jgi:hypothetical protein
MYFAKMGFFGNHSFFDSSWQVGAGNLGYTDDV